MKPKSKKSKAKKLGKAKRSTKPATPKIVVSETEESKVSLRPGLLVSLAVSLRGGVHYSREELEARTAGGTEITRWETERKIADRAEYDRGQKTCDRARYLVRSACIITPFGLLCLSDNAPNLYEQIAAARRLVTQFNATAKHSHITIGTLLGRIETSDKRAISAIATEIRSLIRTMQDGLSARDVKAVREAAKRAKDMGTMLSAEQNEKVQQAVVAARTAARLVLNRVEKKGEDIAAVLTADRLEALDSARFAFLDVSDADNDDDATPSVSASRFSEID